MFCGTTGSSFECDIAKTSSESGFADLTTVLLSGISPDKKREVLRHKRFKSFLSGVYIDEVLNFPGRENEIIDELISAESGIAGICVDSIREQIAVEKTAICSLFKRKLLS